MKDKALIIYLDDDNKPHKTYSTYKYTGDIIIFYTKENKISLPISRLIKIKETKDIKNTNLILENIDKNDIDNYCENCGIFLDTKEKYCSDCDANLFNDNGEDNDKNS